jgi:16S rRNA (cytidine1402-2'-O)-methyltransferase
MILVFGPNRPLVLARELTKKFEEVLRTTVAGLKEVLEGKLLKGEVVLLIGRGEEHQINLEALDLLLLKNLKKLSVKDAVLKVSLETGMARSKVYQDALELKNSQ